jgi:hypothetical protein
MREWVDRHPNLSAWLVLAVGMVAVLVWSARDVGLNAEQWFWLVTATTLVAGLCAWIISWEADQPDEAAPAEALAAAPAAPAAETAGAESTGPVVEAADADGAP